MAIAEQTAPIGTPESVAAVRRATLHVATVPARAGAPTDTDVEHKLGLIGGLLALLAVPLVCLAMLRRRRELSELRDQLSARLDELARLGAWDGRRHPGAGPD